ncbi:MAG TPA: TetR/AcrR family transcriptional regulator [Thermoleophilaceae bacterium]|nr:TetR/AcrR family transcriptional regulator [Thermoleophilaceae bacterium]
METRKRSSIKLTGGPHGIPRAVVHEVQRGRLLDAMADVIAEEGYLATTVHKVLIRARISRRTYYELFKDKEDCFLVAYDEIAEQVIETAKAACRDADTTPERRIEAGVRSILELTEREPNVSRMFIVEVLAAGNSARESRSRTMERLTELVAGALIDRGDDRREAMLHARVLIGGVHELVYDSLIRGRVENLTETAGEIVTSYLSPPGAVHGR